MPTALGSGNTEWTWNCRTSCGRGLSERKEWINIRTREQELMWRFYEGVKDIPDVKVYGDFAYEEALRDRDIEYR